VRRVGGVVFGGWGVGGGGVGGGWVGGAVGEAGRGLRDAGGGAEELVGFNTSSDELDKSVLVSGLSSGISISSMSRL